MKKILFYIPSIIYAIIITIRNILYDKKIKRSYKFNLPIIVIGNIHVGGAGKTPTVAYIASILKNYYNIAIISRGYKRKTHGFKQVNTNSSSLDVGDEALMLKQRFENKVSIYVSEDRIKAINKLKHKHEVFLLDDGFQHRRLCSNFNIILISYKNLINKSYFLPFGEKRDSFNSLKRAQAVIITKVPKYVNSEDQKNMEKILKKFNQELRIIFTKIHYLQLTNVLNGYSNNQIKTINIDSSYTIILLTAIASNTELLEHFKSKNCSIIEFKYPDHYYFKNSDIQEVLKKYNQIKSNNKIIISTEKDYIKLKELSILDEIRDINFYYLPYEIKITNNKEHEFIQFILNYTSKYHKNKQVNLN